MDYGTNINLHLLLHLHWPLYISAILDNHRLYHIPRTSNKKLRERTRGTSARKNCEGLTNTHKISRLLQYGFSENLRWMNHLRTSQISDAIETWTFLVEALWSSHTQKSIETTPLRITITAFYLQWNKWWRLISTQAVLKQNFLMNF